MRGHFAQISVAALLLVGGSARAEWGTYQGNASHTGYVAGNFGQSPPALLWSTQVTGGALRGMAVGGGHVFASSAALDTSPGTPTFFALDQQTGHVSWSQSFSPTSAISFVFSVNAPAYWNGTAYVQVSNNDYGTRLYAFDANTGATRFTSPFSSQWETYLSPTPVGGNLYMDGGRYGGIYSFNATTGAQNWFGTVAQYDGWTPAVDSNYAYVYTGEFQMIDLATGANRYVVPDPNFQWNGYTMNSAVVLGTHNNGFSINEPGVVYPNYSANGRLIIWNTQADATHTPHIQDVLVDHYHGQPTLANGVLYAVDGGAVVALDELTGQRLWSWSPPAGSLTGLIVATDDVLFTTTDTATYGINLASHSTAWSYPATGTLAVSDGTLFIGGSTGTVYALSVPEPGLLAALPLLASPLLARRRTGAR